MAIRDIRIIGDEILSKKCRDVQNLTPRISQLIDDMFETMYKAPGIGIAAPQVGVLRRIVVIDISDQQKKEEKNPLVLINPEMVLMEGEQISDEGCLSVPEEGGEVVRAEHVVVKALDRNFEPITVDATGLLARCIQHEMDHLDGILFVDRIREQESARELEAARERLAEKENEN